MKQEKWKNMLKELPNMTQDDIMKELQILKVGASYEEIVERLQHTYNDLMVADWIFEQYPVDDSNSRFPKEFVDEAVTWIASHTTFPFVHYGVITHNLQDLSNAMMARPQRLEKQKECFQQFFHMCKKFQLHHFDAIAYMVQDGFDLGKELLNYLWEEEDMRSIANCVERFFQIFDQVNPWLEEQLQFVQGYAWIRLKSKKGERLFQQMLKEDHDETEVLYYYLRSYQDDKNRMKTLKERYQKQLDTQSPFYVKIQNLLSEKKI